MIRKRVIFLSICLGFAVNQFMLWECNKVLSRPNYSYEPVYENNIQQAQQNAINNDYRYQGNIVPAQSYEYDENKLRAARNLDYASGMIAASNNEAYQGNAAENYIRGQQLAYEQQIAAQAGVPYEHYICNGEPVCIQRFTLYRQQINAMNNYSNAIRNQNVQIRGVVDMNHYYRY